MRALMKADSPRSQVYKVFSRCFGYPDRSFFRYAKGDLLKDLWRSLEKRTKT